MKKGKVFAFYPPAQEKRKITPSFRKKGRFRKGGRRSTFAREGIHISFI